MGDLSIQEFTKINVARCGRWHPGFPNDGLWTGADWSNAMGGESGEAQNVVKKLRRYESGVDPGPDDPSYDELLGMLADEIGDVFAYLNLLAAFYGIDMAEAIRSKFNRVSERQGFPERVQ